MINNKNLNYMIHNYKEWSKLNEQSNTAISFIKFFKDMPTSVRNIFNLFRTEYVWNKIGGKDSVLAATIGNYRKRINDISDNAEPLKSVITFFNSKGFKQPDNADIEEYQRYLMSNSNIKEFVNNNSDKSSKFDDGTFGVATARASIYFEDRWLSMSDNQSALMGGESQEYTDKDGGKTTDVIKTDVENQSI